jgi:hypothetical protein
VICQARTGMLPLDQAVDAQKDTGGA